MATYQETFKEFTEEMKALGLSFHEDLYHEITKHLGPSIYDADASLVACSDDKELETVKKNFLIGKLGMEDSPRLDEVIEEVCHALGQSNRKKHRATFYYLLVTILEKGDVFGEHVNKVHG